MKKIKFLFAASSLVIAASASAQETQSPAKRGLGLSIGAEAALPVGTFKSQSNYKFGLGGSAKLAIPVAANLDATISAGYIAFSGSKLEGVTDKNTFTTIPFKAGLRVIANKGFYFEPQAGFTQTKISNQEGSGQFTYAFNVGYLISKAVDIAARYEAINAKDNVDGTTVKGVSAKFIGLRLAYNIPFGRDKQ